MDTFLNYTVFGTIYSMLICISRDPIVLKGQTLNFIKVLWGIIGTDKYVQRSSYLCCLFSLWNTLQRFEYISCLFLFLLHIQIVIFPSFHTSFLFFNHEIYKGTRGKKERKKFFFRSYRPFASWNVFSPSWTSGLTVTLNKKTSFNNGFKLHNFHLIYLFSDSCY